MAVGGGEGGTSDMFAGRKDVCSADSTYPLTQFVCLFQKYFDDEIIKVDLHLIKIYVFY